MLLHAGQQIDRPALRTAHDADQLNTELAGPAATVIPGATVTVKDTLFDISDHDSYTDPYLTDIAALLADAVEGATA